MNRDPFTSTEAAAGARNTGRGGRAVAGRTGARDRGVALRPGGRDCRCRVDDVLALNPQTLRQHANLGADHDLVALAERARDNSAHVSDARVHKAKLQAAHHTIDDCFLLLGIAFFESKQVNVKDVTGHKPTLLPRVW